MKMVTKSNSKKCCRLNLTAGAFPNISSSIQESVSKQAGKKQPKTHPSAKPYPKDHDDTKNQVYDVEQASSFGRTLRHASAMSLASLA